MQVPKADKHISPQAETQTALRKDIIVSFNHILKCVRLSYWC